MYMYADGYELELVFWPWTIELSPDDRPDTFQLVVWRDVSRIRRINEVRYYRLKWWEALRVINAEIARITG